MKPILKVEPPKDSKPDCVPNLNSFCDNRSKSLSDIAVTVNQPSTECDIVFDQKMIQEQMEIERELQRRRENERRVEEENRKLLKSNNCFTESNSVVEDTQNDVQVEIVSGKSSSVSVVEQNETNKSKTKTFDLNDDKIVARMIEEKISETLSKLKLTPDVQTKSDFGANVDPIIIPDVKDLDFKISNVSADDSKNQTNQFDEKATEQQQSENNSQQNQQINSVSKQNQQIKVESLPKVLQTEIDTLQYQQQINPKPQQYQQQFESEPQQYQQQSKSELQQYQQQINPEPKQYQQQINPEPQQYQQQSKLEPSQQVQTNVTQFQQFQVEPQPFQQNPQQYQQEMYQQYRSQQDLQYNQLQHQQSQSYIQPEMPKTSPCAQQQSFNNLQNGNASYSVMNGLSNGNSTPLSHQYQYQSTPATMYPTQRSNSISGPIDSALYTGIYGNHNGVNSSVTNQLPGYSQYYGLVNNNSNYVPGKNDWVGTFEKLTMEPYICLSYRETQSIDFQVSMTFSR